MKKKIFSILSSVLCLILIVQSIPMYVFAEMLADDAVEDFDPIAFESGDTVTEEENTVYILGEDVTQRDETTKVFRMSDGSYTAAVYPIQVHYEEDGEMKEIDNTLQTVDGDRFETKAGPVKISLPSSITADNAVEYSEDEHSVMFKLDTEKASKGTRKAKEKKAKQLEKLGEAIALEVLSDEEFIENYGFTKAESEYAENADAAIEEHTQLMMTSDKIGSEITYRAVFEDTDLRYSVMGTTLKEEIILNSATGIQKKYEFILSSDTLTPTLDEDGSVQLCDSDGNAIFEINAPYMYDAAGERSEEIQVKLKKNSDGTYTYTLKPDKKWLEDDARVYPIVIDPPISESDTTTVKDTTGYFATSGAHDPNKIFIGQKNGTVETQGMLYSAIPHMITAGTTKIIKAELMLWSCGGTIASNGLQINAYRITSDWNTSNVDEDSVIYLGTNGKANYSDVLDYVDVTSATSNEIYTWDITEAADEWLAGTNPNYGIALRANSVTSGVHNCAYFYDSTTSYGNENSPYAAVCPQFIYTYRDLRGVEDYWSFTSMSAGRFGSIGVNNYNGNPVMTQPLVSSTGNNMPVSVSLIYSYNSIDTVVTGMGPWRTNYHMRIEACDEVFKIGTTEIATYKYVFIDSDGTRHYLKQEGNKHTDEDGLGLTLTVVNEGDYKYQIETKDKTKYKFDYAGRFNRIIDSNGNFNHIYFVDNNSHKISKIVEGSDMSATRRETTFVYTADGDIDIKVPEGNKATLNYLSATNRTLTAIYYDDYNTSNEAGSGAVNFTYENGTYFPATITDSYGHVTTITNTYSGGVRRVSSISWGTSGSALQKYTFTYSVNSTKVTDIDGRAASYQFNNYGQTVGVVDHTTSWGQNYEYGVPNNQNKGYENKLTLASKTIAPSENRAVQHGFDLISSVNTYSIYTPTTTSVTKSYNETKGNTSPGSMKVMKNSTSDDTFVYQTVTGLSIGNYTLSFYVNTGGINLVGTGVAAQICLNYSGGNRTSSKSRHVTYTDVGEWTRVQVTIPVISGDLSADIGIRIPANTYGVVYVDDIQFEYNISGGSSSDNLSGAGSYNLLENTAFHTGVSRFGWGGSGNTSSDRPNGAPTVVRRVQNFVGNASSNRYVNQTVNVNGSAGDIFIAGGWAKINSIPLDNNINKSLTPKACVSVGFYNGDAYIGTITQNCNTAVKDWQYIMMKVIAPADYTKVVYSFNYAYNTGTAIFGAPFLYKESYGQSYTYDENGNIVSSTDAAETMATFAYQDDALTSSISPTGTQYLYTRSETTNNILSAFSNAGQKVELVYNESGDATSMTIVDMQIQSTLGQTETFVGYIINAKTGRALGVYNIGNDQVVFVGNHYRSSKYEWKIAPQSSNIYTIRIRSNWNLGINSINASGYVNHKLGDISSDYSAIEAAKKFKFVPNGDGTFHILTGESGYTKCLTMSDATYESGYHKLTANSEYDADDLANDWYLVKLSTNTKIITSAEYDADGRYLLKSTDQMGNSITYTYNTATGMLETVTDPKGEVTSYEYDNMRRTTKICSALNENVVQYNYDGDQLSDISVNGGEVVYSFEYDEYGRNESVSVGNGTNSQLLASYEYTGQNMTKQTYGNGAFVHFTYDSIDRLSQKCYNGLAEIVEYFYNCNGQLYKVKDGMADSITLYEYDLAGRPVGTALTSYDGFTTLATGRTKYNDGTGTVSSQYTTIYGDNGFADSEVEYKYTYYGLTTGVSPEAIYHYNANGAVYEYVYDNLGRLVERKTTVGAPSNHTLANDRLAYGFSESYDYVDISTVNNITTTTTLVRTYTDLLGVEHTYYYDANGNIIMEVIVDGNNTEYKSYLYDSQNRMTRYNDSALDLTIVYTYDNRGNILNYTRYEYSAYTNPVNESTADSWDYAYTNTTWRDLATMVLNETVTYDAIGNPLKWQGHKRLTWANGRQLTRVRGDSSFEVNYTYDGDGLRTSKAGARNTEYIILGGTYIGERTTINGTEYLITYIYDADGSVLGIDINGTEYYFVKNLQGDVTAMITKYGEIIGKYSYDAYGYCYPVKDANGNIITDETHPAMLNPFRYRGYYYDVETKFYYLTTRYYDPEACRFINADGLVSTGQGFDGYNMFAYCNSDPVNMIDSTGSLPKLNDIKNRLKGAVEWFDEKIIEPAKKVYNGIKDDINKFDVENTSEEVVLEANYFSSYKGTTVIKPNFMDSDAFSFVFLFIGDTVDDANTVKHEYGHHLQYEEIGLVNYVKYVGIPSLKGFWGGVDYEKYSNYYSQPWEYGADLYGGVVRNGYSYDEDAEDNYKLYWDSIP